MKTKTVNKAELPKGALAKSHELQFNGKDYQQAAYDVWAGLPKALQTDENCTELMSSPDEGCECGFCATAKWED